MSMNIFQSPLNMSYNYFFEESKLIKKFEDNYDSKFLINDFSRDIDSKFIIELDEEEK